MHLPEVGITMACVSAVCSSRDKYCMSASHWWPRAVTQLFPGLAFLSVASIKGNEIVHGAARTTSKKYDDSNCVWFIFFFVGSRVDLLNMRPIYPKVS